MITRSALLFSVLALSIAASAATKAENTTPKANDALVEAIAARQFDAAKSILKKDKSITIDALSSQGQTGLMRLAEEGDRDAVSKTLQLGAKLDAKNAKGETALWYAVYGGHEDLALELIEKGAKVEGQLSESKECLVHYAAKAQLAKLAATLKTKTPACLKQKNSDGQTPAEIAKSFGDDALAKTLSPR